ncbi:uncharacterized protein BO87DRAFT_309465 [Aspergillus neoniger CBS 115656]|uniref:Uncharacterized protein n=1 Tax=Aspergillus neoniger (strain CBS 115656) TaxID=1448310 RepID=A0A318YNS4_ASPNB|nr:hypothetical protein BO87DRAFT_309465 [Aspergillus neoniger CBS 115656]PYH33780.1 hypothetical protein BO87DRAFT_309465 [Aspergillus neoniger CBS 115656]
MASIKNDEHQHQSSTNDPREVEEKLCQLMKDNLHATANDPTEAEKQPHQPGSFPPLDGPPTDSSSCPDNDNKTNEEADEPRIQAKEATGFNNDPSPSPNDDKKTDKRADEEADDSTAPAKDETKPADDELSESSEDESNSPEPDPSETKADRLRRERRAQLDEYIKRGRKKLMPRDIWQMEQDFRRTDWQACATDPSYQPPVGTELELSEAEAEELQRQEREWWRLEEKDCMSCCLIPDEEWLADLKTEQTSINEAADESTTPAKEETKPDNQLPQPSENEPNTQLCPSETKADKKRRERRAQLDSYFELNQGSLLPRLVWKMEQEFRLTDWQAYATDPSYRPPYTPLGLSESEAEELRRQERVFWEQKDLPYDRNSRFVELEYEGIIPNDDWFYDLKAEPMSREEGLRYYEQNFRTKKSKGHEDDRNITAVAPNEVENSLASDQIRTDPLVPSKL